jgi:hypothetical protein
VCSVKVTPTVSGFQCDVHSMLPSRRPPIRSKADLLMPVTSMTAGPPLMLSRDAVSPDRS